MKNEDYMNVSKYGAIKDIHFTPLFEGLIAKEKEN